MPQTSADFTASSRPGHRTTDGIDISEKTLSRLLEDPASILWSSIHRPVKLDFGSLAVEAELPTVSGCAQVFYKRYRAKKWWKNLVAKLRPSRAMRVWHLAGAMRRRGIDTPRPLAVIEVWEPWYDCRSYLAVQWIAGAENLHTCAERLAGLCPAERLRLAGRLAQSLGRLAGHMHAQGVIHGDLKANNLLVAEGHSGLQTWLIDLDQARLVRRATLHRRAADLARLAVSLHVHPWVPRTILGRFFRAYASQFGQTKADRKALWRETTLRSRRAVEARLRRGQPVW